MLEFKNACLSSAADTALKSPHKEKLFLYTPVRQGSSNELYVSELKTIQSMFSSDMCLSSSASVLQGSHEAEWLKHAAISSITII